MNTLRIKILIFIADRKATCYKYLNIVLTLLIISLSSISGAISMYKHEVVNILICIFSFITVFLKSIQSTFFLEKKAYHYKTVALKAQGMLEDLTKEYSDEYLQQLELEVFGHYE